MALYESKLKLELSNANRIYEVLLAKESDITLEIRSIRKRIQATNQLVRQTSDTGNGTSSDTQLSIFRYVQFNEGELKVHETRLDESRIISSEAHQKLIDIKLKLKKLDEHRRDLGISIEKIVEFSEQRDMDEAYLARRLYIK
ncbi:hypothetical protein [Ketobacter alkanivorans]|uniref:hypothetical protein n=1 Tax=Ketobacter alkanivorans TaxID=1917421 RepID=UPI00131537A1|nr:hypothetical protein [Ketobacter alkanivorans]